MTGIQIEITFNDIDFVYNWKYLISLRIVLGWSLNNGRVYSPFSYLQLTLL
jgi:hypothetical protein